MYGNSIDRVTTFKLVVVFISSDLSLYFHLRDFVHVCLFLLTSTSCKVNVLH